MKKNTLQSITLPHNHLRLSVVLNTLLDKLIHPGGPAVDDGGFVVVSQAVLLMQMFLAILGSLHPDLHSTQSSKDRDESQLLCQTCTCKQLPVQSADCRLKLPVNSFFNFENLHSLKCVTFSRQPDN